MPERRLIYKDEDVTWDVTFKIERIVHIIAERRNITFDDAYASFTTTRAYAALQRTDTLMWAESSPYIVDRYFEEIP